MGQRFVSVHATRMEGVTPNKSIRKRTITFGVSLIQRTRDIPNDRYGYLAYYEELSCSNLLEDIIPLIESSAFFNIFITEVNKIKIPPSQVQGSYDPRDPPAGLPARYQFTEAAFKYISTNLDPIQLYPSDFLTRSGNDKEQLYDKVAGWRFTSLFESPPYMEWSSPIQCKPPFIVEEDTETSSSS